VELQEAILFLARELLREVDVVEATHRFILPAAASGRQTCAKLPFPCSGAAAVS
jgi:hypothetical protein